MICAQTYTIKLFEFFTFYVVLDFYSHKTNATKWDKKQNNAYKEMHDAKMLDNESSNAWRVLQRSKELDQGSKEQRPNHKNPSSSKRNDFFSMSVSWEVRQGLEEWEPEMNIDKEVRTLKSFFNNLPFSPKSGLTFISQLPKILSFSSFF